MRKIGGKIETQRSRKGPTENLELRASGIACLRAEALLVSKLVYLTVVSNMVRRKVSNMAMHNGVINFMVRHIRPLSWLETSIVGEGRETKKKTQFHASFVVFAHPLLGALFALLTDLWIS